MKKIPMSLAYLLIPGFILMGQSAPVRAFDIVNANQEVITPEALVHNAVFDAELTTALTNAGLSLDTHCLQVSKVVSQTSSYILRIYNTACPVLTDGQVTLLDPVAAVMTFRVMPGSWSIKASGTVNKDRVYRNDIPTVSYAYTSDPKSYRMPDDVRDNLQGWLYDYGDEAYWYSLGSLTGECGFDISYNANGAVISEFPSTFNRQYFFLETPANKCPDTEDSEETPTRVYKAGIWFKTAKGHQRVGDIQNGVISSLCTGTYEKKCSLVVERHNLVGFKLRSDVAK